MYIIATGDEILPISRNKKTCKLLHKYKEQNRPIVNFDLKVLQYFSYS